MSSEALISARTAAELEMVAKFFGIDMEWNRQIFRHAAQADGRAFDQVIRALAVAIEVDSRRGANERIRESLAREKKRK